MPLEAVWNPAGRLDCVDLGKDFFLIRFGLVEDYDKVLKGDHGLQVVIILLYEYGNLISSRSQLSVVWWQCGSVFLNSLLSTMRLMF